MKTKIFTAGIILLFAVIVGVNHAQKSNGKLFVNLSMINVEALASPDENTNNKGLPTSKEITKYFYDDQGRLSRTEKYKASCCAAGSLECTNPSCSDPSL